MNEITVKWRGIYNLEQIYIRGDVVTHPDTLSNYICIAETSTGIPPDIYDSGFEPFSDINITFIDGGDF